MHTGDVWEARWVACSAAVVTWVSHEFLLASGCAIWAVDCDLEGTLRSTAKARESAKIHLWESLLAVVK